MDVSKIAATLKGGRFYTGSLKKFMIFTVVLSLSIVVLSIIIAFCNVKEIGVSQLLIFIIGIIFSFGGSATIILYFLYQNRKKEKKIRECLKDAVLLEARTKDISNSVVDRIYSGVKIKVEFNYKNIVHVCQSGNKNSKKRNNGYDKVFRKYVNRKIRILYSPKYDEVLMLKD